MTATIPVCGPNESHDTMHQLLDDAGALVVRDVIDRTEINAIKSELAAHLDAAEAAEDKPDDFYPGHTHRFVAIMHRSPTMRELMMHPTVEALGDRHLGDNCTSWQLNVSAGLEIGPGARDQVLHREEDLFPFWTPPRPNLILATMWAMSDFTADNGGTQIVPGSHRWDADRTATPHEIVRAEMSAGSVLFWLGGTLHGGGANVTANDWRYGVILTYTLGWLRQEENQFLSMPFAEARSLPEPTQQRLGFGMHYGGGLGFYDPSVLA